ncbi:MAG: prolyl aminopeptidase [Streptosporangiaceae bacterium]
MEPPYPPTRPYEHGMLDAGDGNAVYWEVCGNPGGKPTVIVHGGPGSGCSPGQGRFFDPERYRLVLFDQRGCGRSTPHASDPATDMRYNTTQHLIADMERLREHLGIERWMLYGYSWGSTLLLAYAEQYPGRVSEIVIAAVTTTRRSDIEWLYRGVGRFFPEAWERFWAGAGGIPRDGDIVGAYARLAGDPDPAVREKATADWCAWEDAVLSGETKADGSAFGSVYASRPPLAQLALVRICSHYFSHGAWLEEGVLARESHRLAGIPGVLIHGRMDMGGPLEPAWELAKGWPGAELIIVAGAGHLGGDVTSGHVLDALTRFAAA